MAGYSGKPVWAKMGLKPGQRAARLGAPADHEHLLGLDAPALDWQTRLLPETEVVHVFVTERAALADALKRARTGIVPDGMVWVSWPKKASRIPSEVTEDVVREVALPMGFVDVKVCAVSDIWSGLKLVIRKELR